MFNPVQTSHNALLSELTAYQPTFAALRQTLHAHPETAYEEQHTADPILPGSVLVQAIQSLVSRSLDPLDPGVVSVTQFHGGEASNVIPATVRLQGTARTYSTAAQDVIEAGLNRLADGIAASFGVTARVTFRRGYPATINAARGGALRIAPHFYNSEEDVLRVGTALDALGVR